MYNSMCDSSSLFPVAVIPSYLSDSFFYGTRAFEFSPVTLWLKERRFSSHLCRKCVDEICINSTQRPLGSSIPSVIVDVQGTAIYIL